MPRAAASAQPFYRYRARLVSMLLLESLRKQCNHPAQGRTSIACPVVGTGAVHDEAVHCARSEVVSAILVRVLSQPEVFRAVLLEYSPCCAHLPRPALASLGSPWCRVAPEGRVAAFDGAARREHPRGPPNIHAVSDVPGARARRGLRCTRCRSHRRGHALAWRRRWVSGKRPVSAGTAQTTLKDGDSNTRRRRGRRRFQHLSLWLNTW